MVLSHIAKILITAGGFILIIIFVYVVYKLSEVKSEKK
jgi:hypothetical protein